MNIPSLAAIISYIFTDCFEESSLRFWLYKLEISPPPACWRGSKAKNVTGNPPFFGCTQREKASGRRPSAARVGARPWDQAPPALKKMAARGADASCPYLIRFHRSVQPSLLGQAAANQRTSARRWTPVGAVTDRLEPNRWENSFLIEFDLIWKKKSSNSSKILYTKFCKKLN